MDVESKMKRGESSSVVIENLAAFWLLATSKALVFRQLQYFLVRRYAAVCSSLQLPIALDRCAVILGFYCIKLLCVWKLHFITAASRYQCIFSFWCGKMLWRYFLVSRLKFYAIECFETFVWFFNQLRSLMQQESKTQNEVHRLFVWCSTDELLFD